ncbi:MAG: gliding motility-associated C-terminal domain-containing protein [Sphingobacteriales bacterium]|nr:gliding motility-associated C-terminal domain-containing protein [Sphingobacteriales bacterium]
MKELFSTTNNNDALWDGTYKGKAQPMGVYAYYIQVICNNKQQTQKGNVTLVR